MSEKVSVIMPVYNSEKFIGDSIQSVLRQTYTDWELMIVDDLSKDGSRELMKQYAKSDSRIRALFKETNSGSADTRNHGIRNATGRYIAFLDSDDLWDETFLEEQIRLMKENDAAFSFSAFRVIDENSNPILRPQLVHKTKIDYKDSLFYNRIGLLTAMYDSRVVGKMYFDVSLKSLRDDYALWLDILKKTPFAIGNRKVQASYRVRKGAVTANKKKLILPHYRMLRNREKVGLARALFSTAVWGLLGLKKYYLERN
ncbi:glycosyltransferase family 2 protein [Leptospira gomenensis]|uniref:Glycosyltransferase family 2 protein n=2 Tax=Leptospira gomenensis TaxID=2484974 RepID=A0A5F1YRW2_9LEPT|nr:glycosyltransferase family 2 protein [Leptospira gomenensis]TGK32563.1 glycosyltransferase family 2 protein [Leptospira gomenensis]TGK45428.1 glycosyltransferase family 2 protein [Leptospira gomenensis]TGK60648.1 glycosyltransferase family 2 protein [Leptospira gomenensis]